jgi:hypothetical protein
MSYSVFRSNVMMMSIAMAMCHGDVPWLFGVGEEMNVL